MALSVHCAEIGERRMLTNCVHLDGRKARIRRWRASNPSDTWDVERHEAKTTWTIWEKKSGKASPRKIVRGLGTLEWIAVRDSALLNSTRAPSDRLSLLSLLPCLASFTSLASFVCCVMLCFLFSWPSRTTTDLSRIWVSLVKNRQNCFMSSDLWGGPRCNLHLVAFRLLGGPSSRRRREFSGISEAREERRKGLPFQILEKCFQGEFLRFPLQSRKDFLLEQAMLRCIVVGSICMNFIWQAMGRLSGREMGTPALVLLRWPSASDFLQWGGRIAETESGGQVEELRVVRAGLSDQLSSCTFDSRFQCRELGEYGLKTFC